MKHLLIIILVLIQLPVLSQTLEGKFQMGGSLAYYTNTSDFEEGDGSNLQQQESFRNNISILPQFGYFINDNISIGGQIGYVRESFSYYSTINQTVVNDVNSKQNRFQFGMFTRVHKPLNDNLYLFMQANLSAGIGRVKYDDNQNDDQNSFSFQAGVQPGILFMITEKFGIEGQFGFLGYESLNTSNVDSNEDYKNKNTSFGLRLSPSTFNLGLQFYL